MEMWGDVRETPLHTGRTGDYDDDETECDENDSNVADGDVRATPPLTGRTCDNDDGDRDDENESYVDDGHDVGGFRYISCDV